MGVSGHRLVLASRSPRRREALAALGVAFGTAVSYVEEELPPASDPTDPVPVAAAKALDVAAQHPEDFVLAGDTLVILDGQALGKPGVPERAREMLRALRGRQHAVCTALALVPGGNGAGLMTAQVSCPLVMRLYTDDEVDRYVSTAEPLDCAGAYDAHRGGGALVERYTGCFSAVVGLPLVETARLLTAAGISVDQDAAVVCTRLYGRRCQAERSETAFACRDVRASGEVAD